ncbi:MAG: N-acetylmuramoyl-L-alanine amidase [Oscillospiraceae bacterium]
MEIIEAFVTQNPLYQQYTRIPVRKLVLHSVGCPQPSAAVFARQWQTARYFAHAVLQADGTVYQVVPWDCRLMHVGAANAYSIGVEMTEPDCIRYTSGATFVCSDRARALAQVTGTYNTAVALFAWLCQRFGLDPNKDIISHAEASAMGIGTDHADPEHLWRQLGTGYTMDGFRRDVAEAMDENDNEEDEESVVRYNNLEEVPSWAQGTVRALVDAGALRGDEHGNLDLSMDMIRGLMIGAKYAEACNPRYNSINDVPSWARLGVQRLVDRGALAGTGGGKLDLSLDMLRTMIVCQRMIDNAKEGKA